MVDLLKSQTLYKEIVDSDGREEEKDTRSELDHMMSRSLNIGKFHSPNIGKENDQKLQLTDQEVSRRSTNQ